MVRTIGLLVVLFVSVGCASRPPVPTGSPQAIVGTDIEWVDTPFFPQEDFQCGPAALATALVDSGVSVQPEELVDDVYLPAREGSLQIELVSASRRHGRIPFEIPATLSALVDELRAGKPVVVLQNLGIEALPVWHYAVVIGIYPARKILVLRSGETRRAVLPLARFFDSWRRAGSWGLILLQPGELPAARSAEAYVKAVAQSEAFLTPQQLHKAYAAALVRWPENLVAGFGLARSLELLGRSIEAREQLLAILDVRPGQPVVLNNLALLEARRGCHQNAAQALGRAMASVPQDHVLRPMLEDTGEKVERMASAVPASTDCASAPGN